MTSLRHLLVSAGCALAMAGAACAGVDSQKFAGLHHARTVLVAEVPSQVNLARYRDLVRGYSTEVVAAQARMETSGERELLKRFEDAESGLKDVLAVWEARDRGNSELLPLSDPTFSRLQKEYDLPVNTNEPPSIYANEAMSAIWGRTKATLEATERN
jgi:hypothetical protein